MISSSLALLLSMCYLLGFVIYLRGARWTGALLPLTMPPLLLMNCAAFIAFAHFAQNADTQTVVVARLLRYGGVLAFVAAAAPIAIIRGAAISHRRPPIIVPALCWLTTIGALALVMLRPTGFAAWNLSLLGAFVSLALLVPVGIAAVVGQRYAVGWREHAVVLGVTAALAAVQFGVAWWLN